MTLRDLRKEYTLGGLLETEVDPDPIAQFRVWFAEAQEARGSEPNAMTVATADASGNPSARIVLLKEMDERGFVFYSNYLSRKGQELEENPRVELLFYWPELERQVRVHGSVSRVPRQESEAYFRSRPLGNQLGAIVSQQSQVIDSREELERSYEQLLETHADGDVPMPEHWGGFRVTPESIEFWQGRQSRLHDRLRYRKVAGGTWVIERLAP